MPAIFEIRSNLARLDWELIKFWKFDFGQNQNWFPLNIDQFFPKSIPNPSSTYTWCIPIEKERKNCSRNPNLKAKKPSSWSNLQSLFQLVSINFKVSNTLLGISRVDPDTYFIQNHPETGDSNPVCSYFFQNRFLFFMHF